MSTAVAEPVAAPTDGRRDRSAWWLRITALGAAAAGALHVAAAVDHLGAGELAVGFFLLTALVQVGFAGWLLLTSMTRSTPDRRLVALALLGTVGLLALYLVAHATNLLDAFAVADHATGAHAHSDNMERMLRYDPVTGVDYFAGMSQADGPVAMAGDPVATRHGPEAVGTATVAVELLTVLGLTALLPSSWRRTAVNGLFALGGLAWILWFAGVLG
ncbi:MULTISPECIES: hypothetical protein [unclassified Geodermatophilus]|uniref:hypothetical protein n=1 Tax=unclassified Geodermatophilus TaxID=2637632 RepID=UPI003EE8573A